MKCLIILAATLACAYAFMGQGESVSYLVYQVHKLPIGLFNVSLYFAFKYSACLYEHPVQYVIEFCFKFAV